MIDSVRDKLQGEDPWALGGWEDSKEDESPKAVSPGVIAKITRQQHLFSEVLEAMKRRQV